MDNDLLLNPSAVQERLDGVTPPEPEVVVEPLAPPVLRDEVGSV